MLKGTHGRALSGSMLVFGAVLVSAGWRFLIRDFDEVPVWRRWIALAAAVALTTTILALLVFKFANIALKSTNPSHAFWVLLMYWLRWNLVVEAIAFVGTFCGFGKSRIAFVLALALTCLVW